MQSRMDKYQVKNTKRYERTKKNTKLYEDVYDDIYRDTTYKNMQVLDSAKEININKLKDMLDDKYDTRQYRTFRNYNVEDVEMDTRPLLNKKENKSYDINEIINEAKSKRAFIEETKEKQKYIDFTKRSEKYDNKYQDIKNEEKELEDLINTMVISKDNETYSTDSELDLLSDLKGNENTIVTNPIDTSFETESTLDSSTNNLEKTLVKADKTFYTDSNMFTKNDFEDFSTLTRELSKTNSKKKIIIVFLIILVVLVIFFLLFKKFYS